MWDDVQVGTEWANGFIEELFGSKTKIKKGLFINYMCDKRLSWILESREVRRKVQLY